MATKFLWEQFADSFPVGVAVPYERLSFYDKLLHNFNSLTPENEFKFEELQPQRGQFNFSTSDKMVKYAIENNMLVRGHTLVWHNQNPEWLFEEPNLKREVLLFEMEKHIGTVVDRYKNTVYCWDVVNEIFPDDEGILRETMWKRYIGDDYVEKAFQFARDANPKAQLYLNEYNCEISNKMEKIIEYVARLKKKNIPIDGIGVQGHYGIYYPSASMVREMLLKFARMDMLIQFTELDVSMFRYEDERKDLTAPTQEMIDLQKKYYSDLFRIFREFKDNISGITFWGVADDYTWLDDYPVNGRKNWPLLFDEHLKPKAVLNELLRDV